MPKMTAKQTEYFDYMKTIMSQLEYDIHDHIWLHRRVPPQWSEIATTRYSDKKVRITLCVEANVVKFFKSMGTGYQARMNDVLAAWMYARLAGILRGGDTLPEFLEDRGERPGFDAD